jgi:hypothetical protein
MPAALYIITCRTLSETCGSGYQHIATVGWSGKSQMSRQQMVDRLRAGDSAETRGTDGRRATVVVRQCSCGTAYLTTRPDSSTQDNLDNLPSCYQ